MSIGSDIIKMYHKYSEVYNKRREEQLPKRINAVKELVTELINNGSMPCDIKTIAYEIDSDFSKKMKSELIFDLEVSPYVEVEINKSCAEGFKIIRTITDNKIKYYLVLNLN